MVAILSSPCKAYRVKKAVLLEAHGRASDAFALLPALLDRINEMSAKQDTQHWVDYKQHPITNAFEAFALAPGPCRTGLRYLRPLIALDGAHTAGTYKMTLFLATGLDANNNRSPCACFDSNRRQAVVDLVSSLCR